MQRCFFRKLFDLIDFMIFLLCAEGQRENENYEDKGSVNNI